MPLLPMPADDGGRGNLPQIVHHAYPYGLLYSPVQFPEAEPVSDADVALAERLLRAYRRAVQDEERAIHRAKDDVWNVIENAYHPEFIGILREGDPRKLAEKLAVAFLDPISHGLGPGPMVRDVCRTEEGNAGIATLCLDRLISLAEAMGLLTVENPDQGKWGENVYEPPDEVAAKIEQALGIPICPPPACSYFGMPVNGKLLFAKSCEHIYSAWRLWELGGGAAGSICEIGGGYGGVAYYMVRMGLQRYTIFDLPRINVLQGYYLVKTLPETAVSLYGEPEAGIRVLPYWESAKEPAGRFTAALNQDSFPEIAAVIVLDYLRDLRRSVAGPLLSINQESQAPSTCPEHLQNLVPDLVRQAGGYHRTGRFPYWLRKGYVEEVYVPA